MDMIRNTADGNFVAFQILQDPGLIGPHLGADFLRQPWSAFFG
jgi:hypothetical protein